ncbi:anhydro-N-acetylmuramic acid kinase [Pseudalkalibacillus berkeleyi]|uniref:Anhydro-N-acetylmuramic acid kinase n=1 Tax=Pseudalkalibacillus berkeleyi TaxID=1069813 RepID=A0ABS9GYC4_9BACL|nr:anhydro-N-acetylmuramic acid kinase [Pseudalkalibacillus berkeleyi]MCF6137734.1 anhydro-N-acetylmuramic acid kinase [Pseudalkalibacillus berkeleyi]
MLKKLTAIVESNRKLAVGLMSGTSLDGVDAALVEIKGFGPGTEVKLLAFDTTPYSVEEREQLIELCDPKKSTVEKICKMNVVLGDLFGEAALNVIKKTGYLPKDIQFISSHGQTIYHWPEERSTLQIGELANIAAKTGILTVGDFRPNDMAYDGQGAPLVPFVDRLLFSHETKNRILLNIGGISNLSVVPAISEINREVSAFDIGPGNVLIDGAVRRLTGKTFDENGDLAKKGTIHDKLLESLIEEDQFLQIKPPKSTGRELYTEDRLGQILMKAKTLNLSMEDTIATITAYTVEMIVQSLSLYIHKEHTIDQLIVSGGGAYNEAIMDGLRNSLPYKVSKMDDISFNGDAKEAIAFTILGNQFLHGETNNLPSATGASQSVIMGKLALPS